MFPSLPLEARLRMEARLRINPSLLRINPSLPMEARLRRIQKRKQKVSTLLTPFIDRIQNGVTHSILSYNSQIPMDLSLHLRMDPSLPMPIDPSLRMGKDPTLPIKMYPRLPKPRRSNLTVRCFHWICMSLCSNLSQQFYLFTHTSNHISIRIILPFSQYLHQFEF